MTSTDLAADGTVIARTFTAPARALASAVERRRSLTALAVATLASLAFAVAAVPRVDYEREASARLDRDPKSAELTPHAREEALATARKVGEIAGYAGAALSPAFLALGAAVFLWLGFRVAGTKPAFQETFAVTAHGMLPVWLGRLLAIPAAIARAPLRAEEVDRLLPSSPAALLPHAAPPPLAAALSGLDLFALWAVALVAAGMARASGASTRRAVTVTAVLYVAWVAVAKVAAAGGAAGPPGGP